MGCVIMMGSLVRYVTIAFLMLTFLVSGAYLTRRNTQSRTGHSDESTVTRAEGRSHHRQTAEERSPHGEDRTSHHSRHHQPRLHTDSITTRHMQNEETFEDPHGMATTRVIASMHNYDLGPSNPRDRDPGRESTQETEVPRSTDTTEHLEGSGHTDNINQANITSNCTSCLIREEIKDRRREAIRVAILNKLGMKFPPNITNRRLPNIPIVRDMLERMDMQGDSPYVPNHHYSREADSYHATTLKRVNFAKSVHDEATNATSDTNITFVFSDDEKESTITRALFYIYIRDIDETRPEIETYIIVTQIMPNIPTRNPTRKPKKRKPRKQWHKKINLAKGANRWYHFDVTKLVQNWIKNPRKNLGLHVEANDMSGNHIAIVAPRNELEELSKPFIEMNVEENVYSRQKREMTGLQCKENDMEKNCCRYPLEVNFEDFKWDWIIAPKTYHANYCSGECPFVFLQKYPHTHLVQQSNPLGSTGPCCTPTKLSPISMLYFDNNGNIVYGKLPGMTVDRCGCS